MWKFLEGDALLPTTPGVYLGPNPPFLSPPSPFIQVMDLLPWGFFLQGGLAHFSPVLALPTTSLCAGWGDSKAGMRNKQT